VDPGRSTSASAPGRRRISSCRWPETSLRPSTWRTEGPQRDARVHEQRHVADMRARVCVLQSNGAPAMWAYLRMSCLRPD
jgi:hypothetical protein